MRILSLFATLCWVAIVAAQDPPFLKSQNFTWPALTSRATPIASQKLTVASTTDLEYLKIDAIAVVAGTAVLEKATEQDLEHLLIVKEGLLETTIESQKDTIGPGSIALILPGDQYSIRNPGETILTYYSFKYRSKKPADLERGKEAGGSFVVNWNDLKMQESEIGGRRQYFEQPTAMFERFEMHVSTLNEGSTSHKPHTHRAEEFVLLIKSEVEMLIGESQYQAATGDVLFIESMIPHALSNIGKGQTTYFAFQWE